MIFPDDDGDEPHMHDIESTDKFCWWLFESVPHVQCHIVRQPSRRRALVETDVEANESCCWRKVCA